MRHLIILAALFSPAAMAQPGLGGVTQRDSVAVTEAPWSSLVRVQTMAGSRCTGALIAPDLVVTAAHCLVAPLTKRIVQPGRVHVLAGYDRGEFRAHAVATTLRLGPGFDPAVSGPMAADWAVLRLATRLPGPVLPLAALPGAGTAAMLGGWQQDRAHALLADTACEVSAVLRDPAGRLLLRHGCVATRGVSGGPLLVRPENGTGWAVAGIAVVARRDGPGGLAVAVEGLKLAQ